MAEPGPTLIYETLHGSHAYGLATPASDIDVKGVIVGPPAWYMGFRPSPEQIELGPDHVRFEIRKLMRLAVNANPTLIELLWTDAADHRVVTPPGERLLAARAMFLSRRVKESFAGYALAQLKRIKTHRRWLLSPPKEEPTRAAFGLPEQALIPRDQMGAAEALLERDEREAREGRDEREGAAAAALDVTPNFLAALAMEKRYRSARREWEQYRTWLRDRNPARAELEARYGYDTKHALHLVRLLRMAVEIAETGRVIVKRPDREELLAIRGGRFSYDELVACAEDLGDRVREAAARSPLPEAPDEDALDALCASIVEEVLRHVARA
jgi:predicted nucleotidyltransferase